MDRRRKLIARPLVALLALATGVGIAISRFRSKGGGSERRTSMTEGKEIARRALVEIFSEGRLEVADELISPDYVGYDIALPDAIVGPDGVKQSAAGYRAAFPDMKITVDEQIAEADTVVTRWTARGTHEGELFGIPPTGKEATVSGITINRISGGKLVEARVNWDTLGLLRQLGALPEPARAS
jgi:steroid delta-isomerase-like uncharacterized protein